IWRWRRRSSKTLDGSQAVPRIHAYCESESQRVRKLEPLALQVISGCLDRGELRSAPQSVRF
ncbi:MAG TPA: hypothetical protein VMI31_02720, partial [Fimbriimonadaceae bacterium]|nr:hypothetical protein [Fimbriimonadaceae bacterium]